jgi:hypothetical protein
VGLFDLFRRAQATPGQHGRRLGVALLATSLLLAGPAIGVAGLLTGTDGRDVLVGTAAPDTINGKGGNDRIIGLGSSDRLLGKRGNDLLVGGLGPDRLFGGAGADQLKGGPKNDILDGGDGADRIVGGGGKDIVFSGPGADRINVRDASQDTISCGGGVDTVIADLKDRASSDCEQVQRPAPPAPAPSSGGGGSGPAPGDIYNCDDFPLSDGTTAQQYLQRYPSDPSNLDGNNDGQACE